MCVAHRMAQPNHAVEWAARVDRPGQHRHRVAVVEQVCVGRHCGQVFADLGQHRDRPQAAEDAADADGVRDGLADAVPRGDVEVRAGRTVSADLDLVHHIVRALDCREPVDAGGDLRARIALDADPLGHRVGVTQPLGVDVVQRQLEIPVQLAEAAQVCDDVTGELDASGPDEGNFNHAENYCTLCTVSYTHLRAHE